MSRTLVHLLRHGEVHNPQKVLYGRLPGFRLSARGEQMALTAAQWFADRPVVHLVTSPLERARQTAEPLARRCGLTPVIDPRVIESENVFEGGTVEFGAGSLRQPQVWRHLYNPLRPSWGEPYVQVAARVLAAAADAREAADGAEAVVVSHQLPIWIARRSAEGRRLAHHPARRQCGLASVTTLVYDDARVVAVRYVEPVGPVAPTAGNVGA